MYKKIGPRTKRICLNVSGIDHEKNANILFWFGVYAHRIRHIRIDADGCYFCVVLFLKRRHVAYVCYNDRSGGWFFAGVY